MRINITICCFNSKIFCHLFRSTTGRTKSSPDIATINCFMSTFFNSMFRRSTENRISRVSGYCFSCQSSTVTNYFFPDAFRGLDNVCFINTSKFFNSFKEPFAFESRPICDLVCCHGTKCFSSCRSSWSAEHFASDSG